MKYQRKVVVAMMLYVPLAFFIWIMPYGPRMRRFMVTNLFWNGNPLYLLLCWIITAVTMVYIGGDFFRSAYKSLKHKSANMDVLIVIGTSAAFLYGTILLIFGYNPQTDMMEFHTKVHSHAHNFETASVLITIVLVGKLIESYSKMKTVDKLSDLASLKVSQANLVKETKKSKLSLNCEFSVIQVELLEKKDLIIV